MRKDFFLVAILVSFLLGRNSVSALLAVATPVPTGIFICKHSILRQHRVSRLSSQRRIYCSMCRCTDEESSEDKMPLLMQRLVDSGVDANHMSICDDDENLEEEPPSVSEEEERKEHGQANENSATIHIKTLIWEVTCDGMDKKYHIVTASKIEDRIQVPALRGLVNRENNWLHKNMPCRLGMAPQEVAESLAGFRSGSIPPIGHTTAMQLFVDTSITDELNEEDKESLSTARKMASIGSGILGKSLIIPLVEFMQVARTSTGSNGVVVDSFIQGASSSSSVGSTTHDQKSLTPAEIQQQRKLDRVRRWPEPKDRLAEFRKFNNTIDKAKLFRSTARKEGRTEEMRSLIDEAVVTNIFPQLFKISVKDGMGKNALHVCAWRGDFETVKRIVETAKELYPTLDVLNAISKGEGNYGKTPLFFALTQCREEVVRYLVNEGADLLIVNNKGQTPCSIAVSHLNENACEFLYQAEKKQLQEGGTFKNYRATNSDSKLYGDLDPRFPIDDINMGQGDMDTQIKAYDESISKAPPSTVFNGVPSQFQPRSLRPTVRWWVREARSLSEANQAGYVPGKQITFTQPRPKNATKFERPAPASAFYGSRDLKNGNAVMEHLPKLTIEDVSDDICHESLGEFGVVLVTNLESLQQLEKEVDACLAYFSIPSLHKDKSYDDILLNSTWAIDCEWKPGDSFGVDNPVATLQLSTQRNAFLVDLQSICQDYREAPHQATGLECHLDQVLSKIFASSQLPILGYGILQDIGKLAASFTHLKCFTKYTSVIDLQAVTTSFYPKGDRHNLSSLKKMTAHLLGKLMDKTEQCSDWTQRPLSESQINYAILDAAILARLLKMMLKQNSNVEGYNGQFFRIHAHLLSTIRFQRVPPASENLKYDIPMGTMKSLLGQHFTRQCWPSSQEEPAAATLVRLPAQDGPFITKKEKVHLKKVGSKKNRPKPIQLKSILGNLDNLPIPGITLGYTKDSCVHRVVGHKLLNTFPEGTHIGFNRKAGVVETSNAWILFCNFGSKAGVGTSSYSNFYEGGRYLSFRLNPNARSGKSSESGLYRHLVCESGGMGQDKQIVAFVREGTRSKYIYVGFCKCLETSEADDGSTNVLFELLDHDELVGERRIATDFVDLVAALQARTYDVPVSSVLAANNV